MNGAVTQESARPRAISAEPFTWLVRITVAIGAMNATLLLVQARAVIAQLYANADYATTVVLPQLASQAAPGSVVILGNHAYYQTWWFERATVGLPYHRQIWELSAFPVEAAGIALLWWCAREAIGQLAGLIVVVTLVCMSDLMRSFLFFPGGRVELTLHAAALCAALILIRGRPGRPRLSRRAALALAGATTAFGALAATDQLELLTVLLPYIVAPWICWLRARSDESRRVATFALGTGGASIVIGLLLSSLMQSEHVTHSAFPITFTAADHLGTSVANLLAAWAGLGGGAFFGLPVAGANLLTAVAGLLCLAALAAVCFALWIRARAWYRAPRPATIAKPVRELYVAFFALVLATTLAVYVLTNLSQNVGGSEHYLLSAWVAVAALLGILLSRRAVSAAILIGVATFGLITARGHIADGVPALGSAPDRTTALDIYHFAASHGAHIGYAEYWDASPVTWETHFAAQVFPVWPCAPTPRGVSGLCPFVLGTISSWFTPRPNTPTFLLTDSRTWINAYVLAPPKALGPPLATAHFGQLTGYVYSYDIASRFGQ